MSTYVIFIRERTTDPSELEKYGPLAAKTVEGHNLSIRAFHGKLQVLEGMSIESAVILEFPTTEEAKAWYDGAAYSKIRPHRIAGGIHNAFLIESV